MKLKNIVLFSFILFYLLLYYAWLITWRSDEAILTLGGNTFSIFAYLIATFWLLASRKKSGQMEKAFWLLLSLGTFSSFLAEVVWMYYENILKIEVPFPGLPDFFYFLQIGFYLLAFSHKLTKEKRKHRFVKFLFDILIVMTVASTFSWHFLIRPIIDSGEVSTLAMLVSLAYPVGDLALLLGAAAIYFGTQQTGLNKPMIFIFVGLLTQIFADSAYLFLISNGRYFSGSLIDPLFSAAVLLIGFSGLLYKPENVHGLSPASSQEAPPLNFFQLVLPYLTVAILFLFMSVRSASIDAVTIGSGISIFLVIIRQILISIENQRLLHRLDYKIGHSIASRNLDANQHLDKLEALRKNEERLHFLAYHDSLTGLANRAFFEETLKQAVKNAKLQNESFAVMFLDLDNFKQLNDRLGHDAGDQLLVLIAKRLQECIRKNDFVARIGGDEFTFIIKGVSHRQDTILITEKIMSSLARPYLINGEEVFSSPSIGIALCPLDGMTAATLLKKADVAMYQVKENGKGHYRLSDTENSHIEKAVT